MSNTHTTPTHPIILIVHVRMPTEKAYGYQTMNMATAYRMLGLSVEVWYPGMDVSDTGAAVRSFYAIPLDAGIQIQPLHGIGNMIRVLRHSKRLAYAIHLVLVAIALLRRKKNRRAIYVVRSPFLCWCLSHLGYSVFYECHDWFSSQPWLNIFLVRSAKKIIVTNRFIHDAFVSRGVPSTQITVAPNGVDLDLFSKQKDKAAALAALGMSSAWKKNYLLLYTGSFRTKGQEKGVIEILRALTDLPPSYVFLAVGGLLEEQARYRVFAEQLGVSDRVHFFPRQSPQLLADFQQAADILLMPFPDIAHYRFFMSPLKTFEYMASGKPIIASRLPSIEEILDESMCFFVRPGLVADLVRVIQMVVAEPEKARQKAAQATKAAQAYSWHIRAQKIFSV